MGLEAFAKLCKLHERADASGSWYATPIDSNTRLDGRPGMLDWAGRSPFRPPSLGTHEQASSASVHCSCFPNGEVHVAQWILDRHRRS